MKYKWIIEFYDIELGKAVNARMFKKKSKAFKHFMSFVNYAYQNSKTEWAGNDNQNSKFRVKLIRVENNYQGYAQRKMEVYK